MLLYLRQPFWSHPAMIGGAVPSGIPAESCHEWRGFAYKPQMREAKSAAMLSSSSPARRMESSGESA